MPVHLGCLVRRHDWQSLQRTGALRLDPQKCRHCGRTRIWNTREGTRMVGPAEGLPEDLVDYLAGSEAAGEAALSPEFDIPIANFHEPKGARSAGRSVSRALDLTLDDRTREPGAPGT